jgi:hypothetical protein
MRTSLVGVCVALAITTLGCGGNGKSVTVHAPYSTDLGLINQVINDNFDICRENADNRIRIIIDDVPAGDTIPRGGSPSIPINATSTWKCSEMLKD